MNSDDDRTGVPHPPYDAWRRDLGDAPEHHAALDDLRGALDAPAPNRAELEAHVERARGIPAIEARIANWWESPATQRWVKALTDAGI